jgi:hypothetical protein
VISVSPSNRWSHQLSIAHVYFEAIFNAWNVVPLARSPIHSTSRQYFIIYLDFLVSLKCLARNKTSIGVPFVRWIVLLNISIFNFQLSRPGSRIFWDICWLRSSSSKKVFCFQSLNTWWILFEFLFILLTFRLRLFAKSFQRNADGMFVVFSIVW